MKTKIFALVLMFFVLTLSSFEMLTDTVRVQAQEVNYWAVLLCSASIYGGAKGGPGDAAYAYHVLSTHYAFNDIYYLHYNTSIPEVNAKANSTNFKWAITDWLVNKSDSNDIIFIFVIAHGAGIAHRPPGGLTPLWGDNLTLYGGQYDENLDEHYNNHYEIREANVVDLYNASKIVDVNGDGRIKGGVDIDEAIKFDDSGNDIMTDDELASALDTLNGKYKTLIFATQQCMGGGLIDDISGPNRIIMTAVDETHLAVADTGDDALSEWSAAFFDALHGEDTAYKVSTAEIIHEGTSVNADYNDDGYVSMLEVFNYTSTHTPSVEGYPQTEWLDDNGNRLPTYVNEADYGSECDNGSLAGDTWFPRRHYNLTVKTRKISGYEISDAKVWIDDSLKYSPIIAEDVTAKTHKVEVEPTICLNGYEYQFSHWEDESTSNPRNLHIHNNTTITAYYQRQVNLVIQTRTLEETLISNVKVWIDDDSYRFSPVNIVLDEGNHVIEVLSVFYILPPKPGLSWKYTFKHWENGSHSNPRTLLLDQNMTITAYYLRELADWGPR